ncbi:MAG: PaaI family thioesterase [Desulfobacteraceae bacterium]|nr:PaaI family thioesterase [Desulfobacteraceae bacterium]
MDPEVKKAIYSAVAKEPFACFMGMELKDLNWGHSVVEMTYRPSAMNNIYDRAHGGALFALIDEAFETASQTDGTIAVALNVNTTYVASPAPGVRLRAEACLNSRTRKTANFEIKVTDAQGQLIALCQAMAYRTGKAIPFL